MIGLTIEESKLKLITKWIEMREGYFYKKNNDGSYSTCILNLSDFVEEWEKLVFKKETERLIKLKLLFVRRDNNWKRFE